MKALQGSGIARVFKAGRIVKSDTNDLYLTVLVEFDRRPNGYAQRIEFRSWNPEDIAQVEKLKTGAVLEFTGEVDAAVMIGQNDRVYSNPRVTGSITQVWHESGGDA